MPTSRRVEIEIEGNHFPVRIARSTRRGIDGYVVTQGRGWIWLDDNGFDELVESADRLADETDTDERGPQLGRLERFPAVTHD